MHSWGSILLGFMYIHRHICMCVGWLWLLGKWRLSAQFKIEYQLANKWIKFTASVFPTIYKLLCDSSDQLLSNILKKKEEESYFCRSPTWDCLTSTNALEKKPLSQWLHVKSGWKLSVSEVMSCFPVASFKIARSNFFF